MVNVTSRPVVDVEGLLSQVAEELQLPASLHAEARRRYDALANYLASGPLARLAPEVYAQGSYRIGTTVRPVRDDEFDLDFVVQLIVDPETKPLDLFDTVARVVEASPRYRPIAERRARCIRLRYADEFHMDIVPAMPDRQKGGTTIQIPDRDLGRWQSTNPKGYASWFADQGSMRTLSKAASVEPLPAPASASAKNALQIATQLVKRHHQLHVEEEHLRTPSIVLTTITAESSFGESVADRFEQAIGGLERYTGAPAAIRNPANRDEIISEKWADAEVFASYRKSVELLRSQWTTFIEASGRGYIDAAAVLKEMFGESVVTRAAKSLAERTQRARMTGNLATAPAGVLVSTASATQSLRANRPHTFFGDS